MEHNKPFMSFFVALFSFCLLFQTPLVSPQLDYNYYDKTCPNLTYIVRNGIRLAIANDTRMAASLLRLHFHDCFVNVYSYILFLAHNYFHSEKNIYCPQRKKNYSLDSVDKH